MTRYKSSFIRITVAPLALTLGLTVAAFAQERVVLVEQGVGTLNEAIAGDTTATGERIDPENTVYELENGGYYALQGTIENRFPMHIRTPEGVQAQLVPAVGDGGEASRPSPKPSM